MIQNKVYSMAKDSLKDLVASFDGYDVMTPVSDGKIFQLQKVTDATTIDLDFTNTSKPPKSVIFPQADCFMTYTIKDKGFELTDMSESQPKTIVLGIRDCDARAFTYLDKVMLEGDFVDPYYADKRKKTVLVGLACNTPPYYNCFCTSLGGSPHSSEGLDIQMVELEDTYLIEPLTEKGKTALEGADGLLQDAQSEELSDRDAHKEASEKAIARHIDVNGVPEKMRSMFESDYWAKVSDPCIGCGICTFLCPTCFCFDIADIGTKKGGQRVRVWDTCQFPEYTMHASSHNPRDTKMKRQRQRFYHKYDYSVTNQQMIGCVGCGRCINQCPTQIDIIDVIRGSMEVKT